jgi:hypothetical protein
MTSVGKRVGGHSDFLTVAEAESRKPISDSATSNAHPLSDRSKLTHSISLILGYKQEKPCSLLDLHTDISLQH